MTPQPSLRRFFLKAFGLAFIIEALCLPAAVLTMGHAGPEGPLALFGWLGLALNFPGFIVAARVADYSSVYSFALAVLVVQVTIIVGIRVFLQWLTISLRSRRQHLTDHK